MSPQDFINKYRDAANKIENETGVPSALILSQAALESNFGKSAPGNNFFGVKGNGPAGSQKLYTTEVYGGREYRVPAHFRKYNNPEESFRDHARLISQNQNYAGVMQAAQSGDAMQVARAIGNSPYATDPQYGQKVAQIMRTYGLEKPNGVQRAIAKVGEIIAPPVQAAEPQNMTPLLPKTQVNPKDPFAPIVAPPVPQKTSFPLSPAPTQKPYQPFAPVSQSTMPNLSAPRPSSIYTVKAGDTPSQISQNLLGDASRWREIYPTGDPRKMQIGMKLTIPRPSSLMAKR